MTFAFARLTTHSNTIASNSSQSIESESGVGNSTGGSENQIYFTEKLLRNSDFNLPMTVRLADVSAALDTNLITELSSSLQSVIVNVWTVPSL